MAKFPTYEEMGKKVAKKALDEFLHDGKSIREWIQIIASEDAISRQAVLDATVKKNSIWNSITNSKGENLEEIISQLPPVSGLKKSNKWISAEVLKKIRFDIALEIIPRSSDEYGDEAKWLNMGLRMALKVIDKYKAESEVSD